MRDHSNGQVRAEGGRAFGALRHRDFRLYWGGTVVSAVGGWMQQVAQGWLVYDLTGSAFLVGLNGLFQSIPFIAVSLYAGTVVDRTDRRRLLIWVTWGQLILSLAVGILVATDHIQIWHIYATSALQGLVGAFESPGRQALLPHLVPRGDLMTAISLNSIQRKGSQVLGPALGGVFIASFGVAGAYFIRAGLFFVALGTLVAVRGTNPPREKPAEPALRAMADGLQYLLAQPVILALILMEGAISMLGSHNAMMVVFAREVFGTGAEGLGLLQSAAGLGSVAGSMVLAGLGDIHRKGRLMVATGLIYGVALLGFALCPLFWVALPLLAVVGAMDIVFGSMRTTMIQLLTRQDMLGRVMSVSAISMRGVGPAGGFMSGILATVLGSVQWAVAVGALASISVLALAGWRVPVVRNFSGVGSPSEPSHRGTAAIAVSAP